MSQILNAIIDKTHLGTEDHGIPSFMLGCNLGGSHQGFGGWDLRFYGIKPILRILEVLGLEKWEDLPGTACRVKRDGTGFGGKLIAIGHFIEDRWYETEMEGK